MNIIVVKVFICVDWSVFHIIHRCNSWASCVWFTGSTPDGAPARCGAREAQLGTTTESRLCVAVSPGGSTDARTVGSKGTQNWSAGSIATRLAGNNMRWGQGDILLMVGRSYVAMTLLDNNGPFQLPCIRYNSLHVAELDYFVND